MQAKPELLVSLRDEFTRWEKLLSRLSQGQITARELPGGLSVKDVVAHLWAWQQLSIARLEAARQGRVPDFRLDPANLDPDVEENLDHINAWIHASNLDRPWADVYRDWHAGFTRFLDLAEVIPEPDMMQPGKYAWLSDGLLASVLQGSLDHHHAEHYVPLRKWMWERGIRIYD
jgi:hypothetical protein